MKQNLYCIALLLLLSGCLIPVQGQDQGPSDSVLNDAGNMPHSTAYTPSEQNEDKSMMEEWEEHMKDFIPSDMINFPLPARNIEIIYEDIVNLPAKVRGAYFISDSMDKGIDFTILDSKRKVVFRKQDQPEGLFVFDAPLTGQYSFVFNNRKSNEDREITFVINCGNSSDEFVKKEEMTPIEELVSNATNLLGEIRTETQFASKRQETYYYTTQDNIDKIFWFSILETIIIIGVTAWQIYYIKKILDNRMIV